MLTKGLFVSEPFLYEDPETKEIRHIIEQLYGKFVYLFAGNANRPIVHVLTDGEFSANALAVETYRKSKVAEGWSADVVEKTIARLSNCPKYTITDNDGSKLLSVTDGGRGSNLNNWNAWFGGEWAQSSQTISHIFTTVLFAFLGGKKISGYASDVASMFEVASRAGTPQIYLKKEWNGKSSVDWLVPIPVEQTASGRGPVNDDGQMAFLIATSWGDSGKTQLSGWRITDKAPKIFRGIRYDVSGGLSESVWDTHFADGRKVPMPTSGIYMSVNAENMKLFDAAAPEIKESVVPGDTLFDAFKAWMVGRPVNPGPTGESLPGGLPSRGSIVSMPNGVERYRLQFNSAKTGTVLGVDGVVVSREWEEMVMSFPMLADSIEFQLKGEMSEAQRTKLTESMNTLREQPEGRVNLVQYASMQPLPYNPLEFLGLQKFAKRADTSVDDEKMANEGSHVVTWGAANKRVNDLGETDYFVTINDPETVRLGFEVRPFIGTAATHTLYFSQSANGIRCRIALKGGSVVGGESDLEMDDALNYSQLGYEFTYDLGLSSLQDPRKEVREKFFLGATEEDLVVADPESGQALNPDQALSQSLDVSRLYVDGSLFFPKLAQVDQPVAALMNKGIDQPEQLRALLQQASVAAFGAYVSDSSRYPNLD